MFKLLHNCTHDSADCNNYIQSWNQVSTNHRRATEVVQEQNGILGTVKDKEEQSENAGNFCVYSMTSLTSIYVSLGKSTKLFF